MKNFSLFFSLNQILFERRGNAEEILTNLGFKGKKVHSHLRIPERFLKNPSKAQGITIENFLDNNPDLKKYLEEKSALQNPFEIVVQGQLSQDHDIDRSLIMSGFQQLISDLCISNVPRRFLYSCESFVHGILPSTLIKDCINELAGQAPSYSGSPIEPISDQFMQTQSEVAPKTQNENKLVFGKAKFEGFEVVEALKTFKRTATEEVACDLELVGEKNTKVKDFLSFDSETNVLNFDGFTTANFVTFNEKFICQSLTESPKREASRWLTEQLEKRDFGALFPGHASSQWVMLEKEHEMELGFVDQQADTVFADPETEEYCYLNDGIDWSFDMQSSVKTTTRCERTFH